MENIIVILILVAIAAGIICYLVRAKKRGEKCIGCPYSKECHGNCNGSCNKHNVDFFLFILSYLFKPFHQYVTSALIFFESVLTKITIGIVNSVKMTPTAEG